jgi:adenylate cyclase
MGDGVNVAARLEGICKPSGLCLSEDAWRQVREKLREPLADLGEKRLKNIAHPVRAYAVSAAQIEASGILKANRARRDRRLAPAGPRRACGQPQGRPLALD